MAIDIVLNSRDKDTDAARFALKASLNAAKMSPGDFTESLHALMKEYECLSLQGEPIFLFPDESVAAWETADSSWTIFRSVSDMLE